MFAPAYMGRKRWGVPLQRSWLCGQKTPWKRAFWTPGAKAFEKIVIGPCTLVRTWGTRPLWSGSGKQLHHSIVLSFPRVVGGCLPLMADAFPIRSCLEEYAYEFRMSRRRSLVQGGIASSLLHIDVRTLGNQEARRLAILAQRNTRMQWLIVHRVA
jgi:hypothetical protein